MAKPPKLVITKEWLDHQLACQSQIDEFYKRFGHRVVLNKDHAKYAHAFDIYWLANRTLNTNNYRIFRRYGDEKWGAHIRKVDELQAFPYNYLFDDRQHPTEYMCSLLRRTNLIQKEQAKHTKDMYLKWLELARSQGGFVDSNDRPFTVE